MNEEKIPFSPEGYRKIIEYGLEKGYKFISFKDFEKNKHQEKICILRHDIDLSLDLAFEMAEYEYELNIKSTYFILLFNDFYNPLSPKSRKLIRIISDLGYEIGFHWNPLDYINSENPYHDFKKHLELLQSIAGESVKSVSNHLPTINGNIKIRLPPEGFINAYDSLFFNSGSFTYVSDSSMRWRQYIPIGLMKDGRGVHFLVHPIWWMIEGNKLKEKIKNLTEKNSAKIKESLNGFFLEIDNALSRRKELDELYLKNRSK